MTAFELKSGGARPFEINQKTSVSSAIVIFEKSKNNHLQWSSNWSPEFTKFMAGLLTLLPEKRTTSLAMAKKTKGPFISGGDFGGSILMQQTHTALFLQICFTVKLFK